MCGRPGGGGGGVEIDDRLHLIFNLMRRWFAELAGTLVNSKYDYSKLIGLFMVE